jgi:HD-like signal output (HDOD) protein
MWSGLFSQIHQDIMAGRTVLPKLSTKTQALMTALKDTSVSILEYHNAIQQDTELTNLVIDYGRTARYYGGGQVDGLFDALKFISRSELSSLVVLKNLKQLFIDPCPTSDHVVHKVWEDALQQAALASAFSARINERSAEIEVPCGLIETFQSQVGVLLIIHYLMEQGLPEPTIQQVKDIPAHVATDLSVLMARHWQLGNEVVDSVHRAALYEEFIDGDFTVLELVHMAKIVHYGDGVADLRSSMAFIKAVKNKVVSEPAEHFLQMVEGHALMRYRALSSMLWNPVTFFRTEVKTATGE